MAPLASTIPQFLYLTLHIYVLRSLLLALSGIDWIIETTLYVIPKFTPSTKEQLTHDLSVSKYHVRPNYGNGCADDVEDLEESASDSDVSYVTSSSSEIYPCEDMTAFIDDADAVQTLASDLEFLVGALAEGIQNYAKGDRLLVQSDDLHSCVRPSSSTTAHSSSASANGPGGQEYSEIMRPHTPKRFSLRIDDLGVMLLKYPRFNLGAYLHAAERGSYIDEYSRTMSLSRQDRLTLASMALSTNMSTAGGLDDVSLSPALLWAPNTAKVKVVLALPLKRTRRRKASSVVVWSNEGEYGNLKQALQEVGR